MVPKPLAAWNVSPRSAAARAMLLALSVAPARSPTALRKRTESQYIKAVRASSMPGKVTPAASKIALHSFCASVVAQV